MSAPFLFGVRSLPLRPSEEAARRAVAKILASEWSCSVTHYSAEGRAWFAASIGLGAPFTTRLAADAAAKLLDLGFD